MDPKVPPLAVTDTHALIWTIDGNRKRLGKRARGQFENADGGRCSIYIPAIVLVELGEACRWERVTLSLAFEEWTRLAFARGKYIASNPATGLLVYTPEGRVAVQIVVLPRPVVTAVPEGPGSVDEWDAGQVRKVIETYDAYFGTYQADEVNHTVTHHVQGELRPNLDGAAFRRRYQIDGDRLTLRSTDPRETWQVLWKRVRWLVRKTDLRDARHGLWAGG